MSENGHQREDQQKKRTAVFLQLYAAHTVTFCQRGQLGSAVKVWKNTLISHVQQDANHHFMDDGRYAEWQAAELGTRSCLRTKSSIRHSRMRLCYGL